MQIRTLDFDNGTAYDTEKSIEIPTTAMGWEIQIRKEGQNNTDFRVAVEAGQVTQANGIFFSSSLESNQGHQHVIGEQRTDIARGKALTLYIAIESTAAEVIEVRWW